MDTTAIKKPAESLVRNAIQLDAFNVFFQEAFNKLTRHIKVSAVGRKAWVFYQARHGVHRPWEALTIPVQLAMANPACTEEDAMGVVNALAGMVHAHYAAKECEVATIKEALRLSLTTETEEIKAEANAIADPSEANLEAVLETKIADDRADNRVVRLVREHLASSRLHFRRLTLNGGATKTW